jgi:SAM-dependent methyltransferase
MSYYPAEYYDPNISTYPKILDRFNKRRSFLHQQINEWLSQIDEGPEASKKNVFEVGCATGDNLEPFVHAGWNAYAIEPNQLLANKAKARGVDVHIGLSESFRWENDQFDIIILNHVLEHNHDPKMVLEKCVRALKVGGLMYVEIPVTETPSWTIFGRYWGNLEFPVHLTMIRKEHLVALLKQLGCRPIIWKTRTLFGVTLRTVEKLHAYKVSSRRQKAALVSFAILLQGGIILLNRLVGEGEAFSVVARRDHAL